MVLVVASTTSQQTGWTRSLPCFGNFLYIFYHDFAKIYGSLEILQKYTSAAVGHGVRGLTPGGSVALR
jgi:hypothetical protein